MKQINSGHQFGRVSAFFKILSASLTLLAWLFLTSLEDPSQFP